tara:strand:+ start:1258 stop:2274 length:1017 start_codon:yes stop_codon:yes gene_type:complete
MKIIKLRHSGLMAQYNDVFRLILEECPTDEEIKIVFDDEIYLKGNFFYNDTNLSCNEIGNRDIIVDNKRVDIKAIERILSRRTINERYRLTYNKILNKFFNPDKVLKKSINKLKSDYEIKITKTLFAYFRGTDAFYERPAGAVPSWAYIPVIEKILKTDNKIDTIILQSDSGQFYSALIDWLWKNYPHIKVVVIDQIKLPNTNWILTDAKDEWSYSDKDKGRYETQKFCVYEPQTHTEHAFSGNYKNNTEFSLLWTSLSIIASKCKYFVGNKSNFSLFSNFYRRNSKNFALLDTEMKIKIKSDLMDNKEFINSSYMKDNFPEIEYSNEDWSKWTWKTD